VQNDSSTRLDLESFNLDDDSVDLIAPFSEHDNDDENNSTVVLAAGVHHSEGTCCNLESSESSLDPLHLSRGAPKPRRANPNMERRRRNREASLIQMDLLRDSLACLPHVNDSSSSKQQELVESCRVPEQRRAAVVRRGGTRRKSHLERTQNLRGGVRQKDNDLEGTNSTINGLTLTDVTETKGQNESRTKSKRNSTLEANMNDVFEAKGHSEHSTATKIIPKDRSSTRNRSRTEHCRGSTNTGKEHGQKPRHLRCSSDVSTELLMRSDSQLILQSPQCTHSHTNGEPNLKLNLAPQSAPTTSRSKAADGIPSLEML
jgi:hypothetical protein